VLLFRQSQITLAVSWWTLGFELPWLTLFHAQDQNQTSLKVYSSNLVNKSRSLALSGFRVICESNMIHLSNHFYHFNSITLLIWKNFYKCCAVVGVTRNFEFSSRLLNSNHLLILFNHMLVKIGLLTSASNAVTAVAERCYCL
jgi:hypothetical protein